MKMQWGVIILGVSMLWISAQPLLVSSNEIAENESTLKSVREFTLNFEGMQPAAYSKFLANIRYNVKDPNLKYGGTDIPVVAAPTNTYIRLNLRLSPGNMVSFAMRRNDLYLAAYMARDQRSLNRVYYFDQLVADPADLDTVFPEARGVLNRQEIIEYDVTYRDVERAAKLNRKEAGLGIETLNLYMLGVHEKARSVTNEAKFLLVAGQILAEATRYRYIEKAVLANFPGRVVNLREMDRVIVAEKNWITVSRAIKASTNGVFDPPLVLEVNVPYVHNIWCVFNANDLDMGILLYQGGTNMTVSSF